MTKKEVKVLGFGILGIVILLIVLRLSNAIDAAQGIQILITFTLVGVTLAYVKRTADIARAAKEQAEASVKMAEEMREQRLSEAQPYLLLRLKARVVQWDSIEQDKHRPTEFEITIQNVGKGTATDLYAALWHPHKSRFVGESKGFLVPNEDWETTISRFTTLIEEKEGWLPKLRDIVEQNKTGIIAVECKDVHKRTWVSYLYLESHAIEKAFVIGGKQNMVELKNNDS